VRREAHVAQLAYYEASAAKHYPDPSAVAEDELGAYLVLRAGVMQEQAGIAWCDEILQAFGADGADR
jgi:hypothetical protein